MLTGDRFIRSQLAVEISDDLNIPTASMLFLQGIAINTENKKRIKQKHRLLGLIIVFGCFRILKCRNLNPMKL